MKISIVIPAYNEEKYIGKTLESAKKLDTNGWDIEILVINGGSTDKTAEVARSCGARVVDEPHKGIGFARQEGLKHATGEIVFFTDADTIVPPDWLKKHIAALTKEDCVLSFGTFRLSDGNFPYYHVTNYIQPYSIALSYRLFKAPLAPGQNIACKKDAALKIGGFDEKLELLEDADFAMRMQRIGKVVFLPDCIVISSGRRSKEGWGYFLRNLWANINFYLLRRKKFKRFPVYR